MHMGMTRKLACECGHIMDRHDLLPPYPCLEECPCEGGARVDAYLGFPKATFIVTEWFEERIEVHLRKLGARSQAPQRLTTP